MFLPFFLFVCSLFLLCKCVCVRVREMVKCEYLAYKPRHLDRFRVLFFFFSFRGGCTLLCEILNDMHGILGEGVKVRSEEVGQREKGNKENRS